MNADVESAKTDTVAAITPTQCPPKPTNPAAVRKAVALGKDMRKQPDTSKADVARKMYETIADEPREIIVQAFVDGAGLTPKVSARSPTPSPDPGYPDTDAAGSKRRTTAW